MANSKQILAKIARNAAQQGLTVSAQSQTQVDISNGGNTLKVTYVSASIDSPMGGVDPSVSPFLGIGIANPGKIKIKGTTGSTINATIDSATARKLLAICAGMANNIILESSDAAASEEIRGHSDLIGMGQ